jgi:hypothetical protein
MQITSASVTHVQEWVGRIAAMRPIRWIQPILFFSLAPFITFLFSAVAGGEPIALDQVTHKSNISIYGRLTDNLVPQYQLRRLDNGHGPIRGDLLFPFELPGGYGNLLNQIATQNAAVSLGPSVYSTSPAPKPGTVILLGASLVGFSCIAWGRNRKR